MKWAMRCDLGEREYRNCEREYPHEAHMNEEDGTRCVGIPVRDDRERTFNPKG